MLTRRLLLALLPLVAVPAVPAAAATGCAVMAVENSVATGTGLVITPEHRSIAYGGCVTFANHSLTTVTITVGRHYSQNVAPGSSTSGKTSFVGRDSGTQSVAATAGPASGHGAITVGASPAPEPSQSPSRSSSPKPQPAPSPGGSSGGTGPRVAKTPPQHGKTRHRNNVQHPAVAPPGPVQSPAPPTRSPSPAAAIVAGPIEPTSGRGAGLPVALAALALVGTGAGLARVLLAEPVDGVETVGGRP